MKPWVIYLSEQAIDVIDAMALLVVVYAAVEAFIRSIQLVVFRDESLDNRVVWLRFARLLVAGLTFQLAADIVETSISTSWEAVGRIAVIAVVRTFLNYFLERDVETMEASNGAGAANSRRKRA